MGATEYMSMKIGYRYPIKAASSASLMGLILIAILFAFYLRVTAVVHRQSPLRTAKAISADLELATTMTSGWCCKAITTLASSQVVQLLHYVIVP